MKAERPTELPPEIAAKLEKRKRFPRARRWLFNLAAALSLVLFVGNYWLWVRNEMGIMNLWESPRFGEWFAVAASQRGAVNCYLTYRGAFSFTVDPGAAIYSKNICISAISLDARGDHSGFRSKNYYYENPRPFGKFEFRKEESNPLIYYHASIPFWFLQLLFAILPLWWLGRIALRWAEMKKARGK